MMKMMEILHRDFFDVDFEGFFRLSGWISSSTAQRMDLVILQIYPTANICSIQQE
jgi:hypothetical protein